MAAGAALLAGPGATLGGAAARARGRLLTWALLLRTAGVVLQFLVHYRLIFAIMPLLASRSRADRRRVWPWLGGNASGAVRAPRWSWARIVLAAFVALEHSAKHWRDGGLRTIPPSMDAGNRP